MARADLLGPPERRSVAGEFLIGIDYAVRGALLTIRRPRLLGLVVIPLLLNVLIASVLIYLVVTHRDLLRPDFEGEWIVGTNWLRGLIQNAAVFFGVLIGIGLAVFGTLLVSTVVNAPFLEWLSECVESIVFGQGDETPITPHYVWHSWIVPVIQALGLAIVQGFIALALLVLSFTGIFAPLVFLGGLWLTAITLCDICVARKRYPVIARFSLVARSLGFWLGVALPFFLVPILIPFGVAGATLGFLRQRRFPGR